MAIQVDILGSRVCRDVFRYAAESKYEVDRCIGNVPITTIYEKQVSVGKEEIASLALTNYEKRMTRVQLGRGVLKLLKKSEAEYLIIDLADELLERCEIEGNKRSQIAFDQRQEKPLRAWFTQQGYELSETYSPREMDIQIIENCIKQFARDIVRSEENPEGYLEKNIIVIEALYASDVMGNDGEIHSADEKYKVRESNEWLKSLYSILYKYIQDCRVIKLPEFTHATQNHIRGAHPLHYTEDTYLYIERMLDVLFGYSKTNSMDNIYKEQSLKNRLKTRVLNSNAIYSIGNLKNRVAVLEDQGSPIKVDTMGSCVSRDIFRYTFPGRYEVCVNIQRTPITCLYQDPLHVQSSSEGIQVANFEQRMFHTQMEQTAIEQLKNSKAEILIIDLSEERFERYEVVSEVGMVQLAYWASAEPMFRNLFSCEDSKYKIAKKYLPFELEEDMIRKKYKRFAESILKTESNPKGYRAENIYVVEAKYAEKVISNAGCIRDYHLDRHVEKYNQWFEKLYTILYEYLPGCKVIKLPQYTYASENHMWGGGPLYYTEATYEYFGKVLDVYTKKVQRNTVENLYKEQSLENKLYVRLLNGEGADQIENLKKNISLMEKKIEKLEQMADKG